MQAQQPAQPAQPGLQASTSFRLPVKTALDHWKVGLFSCCGSGCYICVLGSFCPCILYGDIYNRLYNEGHWSRCCLYFCCSWAARCFFAALTRHRLRMKYAIHVRIYA
jgi:Cys-rich protein (TIGR01571 family)